MGNSNQIQLSDGTEITVGPLTWQGYKAIKKLIVRTVSGPVLRETVSILTGPVAGIIGDLLSSIVSSLKPGENAEALQAGVAAKLADKWGDAQTVGLVLNALDQLKVSIASALMELLESSDDFTEILIAHSCQKIVTNGKANVATDGLTVADVVALRDAALEINDLNKLLDLEKNWWGRVMTIGRGLAGTPASNSPGTSTSNIDSAPLTTGL